jgi:hypothetical protein
MITFQLDQCFNDRRLAERCNAEAEGRAQVFRYPRRLFGVLDPDVLADLIPRGNPLVTTDRAMPGKHAAYIVEPHPGIVVVCYSSHEVKTITTSRAAAILVRLKEAVPGWYQLPVANSVLFITEVDVEVCRVEFGTLMRGRSLPYTDPNWTAQLIADLEMNASRYTLPSS